MPPLMQLPDAERCASTARTAGFGWVRCKKERGHPGRHHNGTFSWGRYATPDVQSDRQAGQMDSHG